MKVVTVHRGSRDGYQVANALEAAGLLDTLVTDLYWPADQSWARGLERLAGAGVRNALRCRYSDSLPATAVTNCAASGMLSMALSKIHGVPFEWERGAVRWCDFILGREAGRLATRNNSALLSYSYYAHSAFSEYRGNQPRILFQMHPHPASVREILRRERDQHPDCASSLDKEWELALPESDYQRLTAECSMADHWIAASQFTKSTLVREGIPADRISVVPYGIDSQKYFSREKPTATGGPLKLLYVGTLSQRKGVKYLIQAISKLRLGSVELTVCGRPVDDLELFHRSPVPIRLFPAISSDGLLAAYREADVFVFPSLAEGFAQVLLEAMASGLPVISTDRTAAPELIRDGIEGFLVEPGNTDDLSSKIETCIRDPRRVAQMGLAARERSKWFTWERFRHGIAECVGNALSNSKVKESCFQA